MRKVNERAVARSTAWPTGQGAVNGLVGGRTHLPKMVDGPLVAELLQHVRCTLQRLVIAGLDGELLGFGDLFVDVCEDAEARFCGPGIGLKLLAHSPALSSQTRIRRTRV
jgi:hypothetical protein